MPKKFSELLRLSWAAFSTNWQVATILAVIFAVLMTLSQLFAVTALDERALDMMGGMNEEQMEQLVERMENGDEEAMNEFMQQLGMMNEDGTPVEDQEAVVGDLVMRSLRAAAPAFGIYFLLTMIISVISQAIYLVFVVQKPADMGTLFSKGVKMSPKLLGVWLWMFLRSFAWIPIIGIIPAIIIGPRLALSPYLLIKENKSITGTVAKSHAATAGYWGKIVGNSILLGLVIALACIVIMIPLAILEAAAEPVGIFGSMLLGQITTVFCLFFVVNLADTILKNPRTVSKTK